VPTRPAAAAELPGRCSPPARSQPLALQRRDVVPGVLLVTTTGQSATDAVVAAGDRAGQAEQLARRVARVEAAPARRSRRPRRSPRSPGVLAVEPAQRMTALARRTTGSTTGSGRTS
jgi:hypothetical protein